MPGPIDPDDESPSDALERKLAAASSRITEQARLYDAALSLGAASSMDEIVEIIACYLDPLSAGASTILWFEDGEDGQPITADAVAMIAIERRFPEANGRFSLSGCPFRGAVVSRDLLMIDDVERDEALDEPSRAALLEAGRRSVLSAPLFSRSRLVGRLLVTWPSPGALRAAGHELAVALARQASATSERLMLIGESKRQVEERNALQARVIEAQRSLIEQLQTPVIPVADGVVLMPLIGRIDEDRTQRIMDALLTSVASRRAATAILDISGVPAMTGEVAEGLARVGRAAGLLGARVVLTGVRPDAARALTESGMDMSGLTVRGSVQDGIALALMKNNGRRGS